MSEQKHVTVDDLTSEKAQELITKGYASSFSGAIRIAVIRYAEIISAPRVTPSTP